jgi:hypothetical protein
MGKKVLLKVIILAFLLETSLWSGTPGVLEARAIGLAEAVVALVDDSSATYWNPANLCLLSQEDIIFTLMSSTLAKNDVGIGISYARPVSERLSFGSNISFHLESQDAGYYDAISDRGVKFGDFFYLIAMGTFSGSYKISSKLSLGANFKILGSAWGIPGPKDLSDKLPYAKDGQSLSWVVDFGAFYQTPLQPVVVGLVIKNMNPNYAILRTIHLGVLWKIFNKPRSKLFLTFDPYYSIPSPGLSLTERLSVRAGVEWKLFKIINLRLGYQFLGKYLSGIGENLSLGLGVSYRNWSVDYAYGGYFLGKRPHVISFKNIW